VSNKMVEGFQSSGIWCCVFG